MAWRQTLFGKEDRELLDVLSKCKGKFLLSGYPSALYDEVAGELHWHHVDFELANHASGKAEKQRMTERLWMNFEPQIE